MRVINVVKIKDGLIDDIESFGIFEEQLSNNVVEQAQKDFFNKAKEIGCDIDDEDCIETILDNGYYESVDENRSVCISWSNI